MLDVRLLTHAVGDLDERKVSGLLQEFVASNPTAEEASIVVSACQRGMAIVGELFEANEYFVGDLILAGELLTSAISILKPVMGGVNSQKIGSIVLATVKGDLHDIGKNIFAGMAEAAGFAVFDLGIDVPAGAIVEKVKEVMPQIVGLSGLLTLSLDSMKDTVDQLAKAGLRNHVKVIIGGNPVTEAACTHIGADAFTTNTAQGVRMCHEWVG